MILLEKGGQLRGQKIEMSFLFMDLNQTTLELLVDTPCKAK